MKKLLLAFVVAGFFASCNNEKTCYVETHILLEQYEGMKKARVDIDAKNLEYSAGVDSLINLFQDDLKAYEQGRKKMSTKERELKEELLHVRQQQVASYQQAMQKKAMEEEQKIKQTHINRINDFLKKYGKEKGYRYILGANGSGNVVYAQEDLNITEEVLEGLNKQYNTENGLNKQ
ncbi:OmpH family outer membrane protein [Carboxylicivirga sediminis]|uniref:OmpH family outer membrane protein n=1 Tax=Carboxylicivirga sediminis TaxID=2006564 RepID=A0A941IXQ7_9BACT|nr:OmpH family outer membrane protein [Carboxylicivirga sediminis]MBR8534957.1 OmpH family outer membrane protein [Carboxylicivirga sediminis]